MRTEAAMAVFSTEFCDKFSHLSAVKQKFSVERVKGTGLIGC
jgi:hypothetical protein